MIKPNKNIFSTEIFSGVSRVSAVSWRAAAHGHCEGSLQGEQVQGGPLCQQGEQQGKNISINKKYFTDKNISGWLQMRLQVRLRGSVLRQEK